jgi:hypothetical protein
MFVNVFQLFVIITHLNIIVSNFRDWFWRIGMWPRIPQVGLRPLSPYSAEHSRLSYSLSFIKWRWLAECFLQ